MAPSTPSEQAERLADRTAMLRLAWPALCENLLSTLVQFVDTAMVGALGAAATAAVGVNASPMWLMNGLVSAIGVGGTALVARQTGAGDHEGAEATCRQVFQGILVLSALICAAAMVLAQWLPAWMQADPSLHADATAYLRIVAAAFVPHFTGMALGAVMRGAGNTRTPMQVAAGANLLNVVGNFLLIFPTRTLTVFGVSFPMWGAGLGVRGAAISTAVSTALAGLVMVYMICRPSSRVVLRLRKLRLDMPILRRILNVGFPAALERLTLNVGQIFFVGLVSSLGTAQLAAHHLSLNVESLSYMPGFAFGVAATTLIGQSLGAQDPQRAMARGALCIRAGVVVMSGIGVLLFAFAPWLIAMLSPDEEVRAIGTVLIRICAFEQPFMAMSMIGAGALRGAGDTRVPFYVSLAGMWGVRLILAWLLAIRFGLGVNGAWYAMVTDLCVRGVLMYVRFARGKWKTASV